MKESPQIKAGIIELIEKGLSLSRAAQCVDLHRSTLAEWIRKDKAFAGDVERAEARFIARMTENIADAAKSDWRAGVEILKRRFPSEFSATRKIELNTIEKDDDEEELRNSPGYRGALEREARKLGIVILPEGSPAKDGVDARESVGA